MATNQPRKRTESGSTQPAPWQAPRQAGGKFGVGNQAGKGHGRPPGVALVQQYAGQFSMEAVDVLVAIMRQRKSAKEARQAALGLLDRACGRPAQPIAGVPGSPLRVDDGGTVVSLLRKLAGEKTE